MNKKSEGGFTLVELIIVIIIIGILAALAIPQFMDSTTDARDSTLRSNLAVMRNSVSQYYHQHNSTYPGRKDPATGNDTADAAAAATAFAQQLTQYTDVDGAISLSLDRATYPFGMYFQTGVPENPMNGFNTVTALVDTDPIAVGDIDNLTGWLVNVNTGEIRANTTGTIAY